MSHTYHIVLPLPEGRKQARRKLKKMGLTLQDVGQHVLDQLPAHILEFAKQGRVQKVKVDARTLFATPTITAIPGEFPITEIVIA